MQCISGEKLTLNVMTFSEMYIFVKNHSQKFWLTFGRDTLQETRWIILKQLKFNSGNLKNNNPVFL